MSFVRDPLDKDAEDTFRVMRRRTHTGKIIVKDPKNDTFPGLSLSLTVSGLLSRSYIYYSFVDGL